MPTREPSNREILNAIQGLSSDFKVLSKQVAENTTDLKDVQETVEFLKDNAVMWDEFHEGLNAFRKEVWGEFRAVRSEIPTEIQSFRHQVIQHVDGFIGLYQKQEVELAALAHRMTRHESTAHG